MTHRSQFAAALVAAALLLTGCANRAPAGKPAPTVTISAAAASGFVDSTWINIYLSPSLTGAPYTEPISTLWVRPDVGSICYANDNTGKDPKQYYTRCADFLATGGHYAAK